MRKISAAFIMAVFLLCLSAYGNASDGKTVRRLSAAPVQDASMPCVSELPEVSFDFTDAISFSETASSGATSNPDLQASMSITSGGVSDGVLADEYGMRGKQQKKGVPTLSPLISIKNAPEGTVCFAVVMRDPDSTPLCGYEWTHWLAANVSGAEIAENASIDSAADMAQGKNDFGVTGYGGPTPPDKPHTYIVTVYAMDARLDLKDGFSKDALEKAMDGHVLAEATLSAKYDN